jgi:hypothetical protein
VLEDTVGVGRLFLVDQLLEARVVDLGRPARHARRTARRRRRRLGLHRLGRRGRLATRKKKKKKRKRIKEKVSYWGDDSRFALPGAEAETEGAGAAGADLAATLEYGQMFGAVTPAAMNAATSWCAWVMPATRATSCAPASEEEQKKILMVRLESFVFVFGVFFGSTSLSGVAAAGAAAGAWASLTCEPTTGHRRAISRSADAGSDPAAKKK